MSKTPKCKFCKAPLITGDEAGCYCSVICVQCGRVQAEPDTDNARRARDRAQVERHVAGLIESGMAGRSNFAEAAEDVTARILRYLRRTRKEWR